MPLAPEVEAYLERQKGLPPRSALSVVETRAAYRRAAALAGEPPALAAIEEDALPNGVRLRRYQPGPEGSGNLVVYFHGGRFFSGDLETHDTVCRCLALASGWEIAAVDYRLGPERRFPAAVEDAQAAVEWAARRAARVAVAGDSAGGNLAAVAALTMRDGGGPPLVCQVLVYPMMDATCSLPSHREFAAGYGPGSEDMLRGYREYLSAGADLKHPHVSPLWAADLAGLPPALVLTAEYDSLRDEGEAYAWRMAQAGVPATLHRYLGARPRIAAEKFGSGGMLELREGQPDGARAGFAEFWAPKRHLEWLSC
jgi:acetyl esterase